MAVFDPLMSDYTTQLYATIGEKLYLKSELADVHFIFESNGERVPAHKILLKVASDVFATMFNESWKENDEVIINDESAAAFKEFLQFFYFGKVKLTMENAAAVMNLGEKYNVTECLAVCSKFLKNNLNDDNVCRYYGLAILLDEKDLKQTCETFIGFNTINVFNSNDFLSCDRKILAQILKLNMLSCTESELFEACMSWVKLAGEKEDLTKEIIQTYFGNLFYDIRYGSMSVQEFSKLISTYEQLFTARDYASIIQLIGDKNFKAVIFNENREKRSDSKSWNYKDEIGFYRLHSKYFSTVPYFIKNLETTKFSIDEPLLLNRFTFSVILKYLDGKYIDCEDVSVKLAIVEVSGSGDMKKEVTRFNGETKLNCSTSMIFLLPKPIYIRPGFIYEIRSEQNLPDNCAIGTLVKSNVQIKDGINIQFYDDPLIPNDCSSTGLIYKLFFYPTGN